MPLNPFSGPESKKDDSDSEEDPLDAFMANLESEAKTKGLKSGKAEAKASSSSSSGSGALGKGGASKAKTLKGVRDDIEEEDDEEQYYKWMEENPNAGKSKFLLSCISALFESSCLTNLSVSSRSRRGWY